MLDILEPPRPSVPASPGLSHVKALERGLPTASGQRKRDRTRARLLWATAQVLEAHGYDRTRVADVSAVAGVSSGAFYFYFVDRDDAARQLLNQFVEHLFAMEVPGPVTGPQALRRAIVDQLALAKANRGLLRALYQAMETTPALGELLASRCADWVGQANALAAGPGDLDPSLQAALESMVCGAQRRVALQRVSEVELQGLAGAMTRIWRPGPSASVDQGLIN
jgi:AcrR family transcriptional regulator